MTSAGYIPWKTESHGGKPFHLARHRLTPGAPIRAHRHGFAEVFWVEAGGGVHRTLGGELPLVPGVAACLRPDDVHGLRAGPQGLVLVNVSFPCAAEAALARGRAAWPWRAGGRPRQRRLPPGAMERLHGWTAELSRPGAGRPDLDAFLLDLARLMQREERDVGLPPHLQQACSAFAEEARLPGGSPELAALCGCGPAHLNRLCRRWHGCTASELVARIRLDWASRELRLTARPVAELAAACGMPHLGHFYRRFRQRFGTTPKAWRDAAYSLFSPTSAAPPTSSP